MTHDHSLEGTEGLLSTHRHHRHGQLRLVEDLVVLCILGKRGKLRESGPHSTWLRLSGDKEISGGLVRLTRIAGKVVPYPVKVDTLPTCHQPLRIRSMEVEVPNPGILQNLAPGIDPGDRRVHNNQPLNLIGISRGVGGCNHVADGVSNNNCLVVSQRGHNGTHILGLSLLVVAVGGLGGPPNAAEVWHHYRMVLHEICGQRSPRIAIFRVPMDEYHNWTASSPTRKNICPFRGVYRLCLKARRQGGLSLA